MQSLAAAQAQMGKALKTANNPHFKSKYADLASVMDACLPALNANGIAVIQPPYDDETGRYVKTIFLHGDSGETLECRTPLITAKNDMQGYGSAVTYARRYGLMGMAGLAPEDDDGNAAVRAAPQRISADQIRELRDLIEESGTDEAKFCGFMRVADLHDLPADAFANAVRALEQKIERARKEAEDA